MFDTQTLSRTGGETGAVWVLREVTTSLYNVRGKYNDYHCWQSSSFNLLSAGGSQVEIIIPITAHLGKVFLWEGTEGRVMTRMWHDINMRAVITKLQTMMVTIIILSSARPSQPRKTKHIPLGLFFKVLRDIWEEDIEMTLLLQWEVWCGQIMKAGWSWRAKNDF